MRTNWVVIGPDGEKLGYHSGWDIMQMCHRVHADHLPGATAFVGLLPVTAWNANVYAVFGVTAEGGLVNTGYQLDGRPEKWTLV